MSDVRDFGAAGDGKIDDTEAILHAVKQSDGYLVFSPGRYRISRTLEFNLDAGGPYAIDGSGGCATLVMEGAGPAIRFVGTHKRSADPGGVEPRVWKSQRMPTITQLAIEGANPQADGVRFEGVFQPTLAGVHIRQVRNAVYVTGNNRNLLVSHCHIYHNRGIGVLFDRVNLHQVNIVGNHISYNRLGGIRIENSEVRNLQITGNDIEYNNHRAHKTEPEPTAEIFIDTTAKGATVNEVTICSNTIQATPSSGGRNIFIHDQIEPRPERHPGLITVTGNVIGNQETNVHLIGCHGVVLSGNTIYSCDKYNLLIEGSSQINLNGLTMRRHKPEAGAGVRIVDSRDSVINGCTVEDEAPEGQASGVSTLEIERCQRINISGSQFLGGVPYCADVADSSGISFTGCTLADTRAKPRTKAAIRFRGPGERNLIGGCTLGPAAGPAADLDESSHVTLAGNVVTEGASNAERKSST